MNTWEVLRTRDEEESEQGEILHMGHGEGEWEEVKITVDSGAVDTVGPRTLGKGIPLLETEASKQRKFYRAANDTKIAIHGKKNICGYTAEGTKIGMDVQIAEVKKTLGSVRRICEAGNRVVFDEDGSYVENKSSGERTALQKEKGSYVLTLWVPRESGPKQKGPFPRQGRGAMERSVL